MAGAAGDGGGRAPRQAHLQLPRGDGSGGWRPPEGDELLEGEVVHVAFENDETGFRVLHVVVGDRRETVVGVFPRAPIGTRVRATGRRVSDRRFGPQFRADTLLTIAPSTLDGVRRFLGSGIVNGIGPAMAERIVDAFGTDTLKVLDTEPERLREVSGIGKRRAASIATAWRAHHDVSGIMVFLQAHGASPALAMRIYKRFGPKAMAIVSKSPYRLALDVWGIGFKTADSIARSIGIAKDAPERVQAGLLHLVHESGNRGDVFAEQGDLVERATEMLECDEEAAEQAIVTLAAQGRLVVEDGPPGTMIYDPALHAAELRIAERLAELAGEGQPLERVDFAMEQFERAVGMTLADAQRSAVAQAATYRALVITGGPGVGKTTIVRAILALFDACKVRVRLAAPTGRAAKRMSEATGREASTIHRLLEFDPQQQVFQRDAERPLDVDALIVDETSMVDVLLGDALLQAVPDHARLVLVGDVDQLPSVGPGALLRDVIGSGQVPCVRLVQIFRQAEGSSIVQNAHRIHRGEAPVGAEGKGEQFYVIERRDADQAKALIRELVQRRIPASFGLDPVDDVQVLTPMQRGPAGAIAINEMLQEALNPAGPSVRRGQRLLRLNDKVMQLRNDYGKEVFNGDIGRVVQVDAEERRLTVSFDGREVPYSDAELDELTLAYATSIHKSQGSEYAAVVVPLLTQHFVMLSRNLIYTAVTRGKRLVILIADPRALSIALAETRKEDRRTLLAHRLALAGEDRR